VSDSLQAEIQHWQGRTDDMQVSLDRMREDRDELRVVNEKLSTDLATTLSEVAKLRSLVSRIQVAMSQGQEL
jgi:predicted  nucleic acid-binding Zn-ribbon protein